MIQSTLLSATNNPFINLLVMAYNYNIPLNEHFSSTFNSLLDNDLYKEYDLNEKFYLSLTSKWDQTENIIETNCFHLFSLLSKELTPPKFNQFFSKLLTLGLDITQETNSWSQNKENEILPFEELIKNSPEQIDSIFCNKTDNENIKIYFLTELLNQLGKNKYESRLNKYNAYHNAVALNKNSIIKLFNEQNIDVNCLNDNLETPVMFSTTLEQVQLFHSYNCNWLAKNIEGKDALSFFNRISTETVRTSIVNFVHTCIKDLELSSPDKIDPNYSENRLKQTLLEMVASDKTKKELDIFIKQHKIKDIENIVDQDGNNLAMISLKNNNWARYSLFQKCNPEQKNKWGENSLHILLNKTHNLSNEKYVYPILENILENSTKNILENLGSFMIERSFVGHSKQLILPKWLFGNFYKLSPFLTLLGFNDKEVWQLVEKNKSINSGTDSKIVAKLFYEFYTEVMKKQLSPSFPNSDKIINHILERPLIINEWDMESYNVNSENLIKLEEFFIQITNNYNNPEYEQNLLTKLEKDTIPFIQDGYFKNKEYRFSHINENQYIQECKDKFCKSVNHLLEFFVNHNQVDLLGELPTEMTNNENLSLTVLKGIQYAHLNKNLDIKPTIKKINKI
jgi:hypothetical protein